jgi:N-acetylneuraminate lyase
MILREEERKLLAEAWVAAGKAYGVKILNHIGAQGLAESCELARHAQAVGCDAICAMAPQFFKTAGARGLALWLKEIGAAAPALPLYYYNFPAITGVDTRPDHLISALEEVGCPTFRGMKFTEFNCWYFMNCLRQSGGIYDIAYGRDECLLAGLATGAKGHIGNGFNFAAGVYQRIREAFAAGDVATAQMWQERANTTVNIMNDARFGGQGLAISRLMYEWKGAVRLGPPRAPFSPLTPPQQKALEEELKRVGFFQWCDGGFEPREVKARV